MSQYRVRNWSEYSRSLTNRGNCFLWIEAGVAEKWKAKKDPRFIGAPLQYSDDAILCMMAVKVVLHLPYRQLIGFFLSVILMMGFSVFVPHFTTVASRARRLGKHFKTLSRKRPKDLVFDASGFKIYGEGEWTVRQHGKQKRRRWKKFHIAMCPKSHEIILAEVTDQNIADCQVMPKLLKRAPRSVKQALGDGAFDTASCYQAAYENNISLLTPPRRGAVWNSLATAASLARDQAIAEITILGGDDVARGLWKKLRGYHRRSLVETTFSRFKRIFGSKLFSKRPDSQYVELMIKAKVLNRMSAMGMPKGVMV